jgi:hypothetical protein
VDFYCLSPYAHWMLPTLFPLFCLPLALCWWVVALHVWLFTNCDISLFTVHLSPWFIVSCLVFPLLVIGLSTALTASTSCYTITMVYRESGQSSITNEFIWVYCCDADGDHKPIK